MLTTLAVLVALTGAKAQVVRANPGSPAFRWLSEFERADAPTAQELMGYFSGRCYAVSDPTKPLGYALMGETRWVGAGADRKAVSKVTVVGSWVLHSAANTADEFDNPSDKSVADMKTEMDHVFVDPSFSILEKGDNFLLSDHGRVNVRFEMRSNKRYIIVRMASIDNDADRAYCHFFKTQELRQQVLKTRASSR